MGILLSTIITKYKIVGKCQHFSVVSLYIKDFANPSWQVEDTEAVVDVVPIQAGEVTMAMVIMTPIVVQM